MQRVKVLGYKQFMLRTFSFQAIQQIPVTIDQAWDFFSDPSKLQVITPPDLGFRIISKYQGSRMYPGQLIEYTVRPILDLPLYWMTEITHVADKNYFIDEQRSGPYSFWHHQHHFREIEGGIEMTDIVHYQLPFWVLGNLINAFFIQKQLRNIFQYRHTAVEKVFGKMGGLYEQPIQVN